jgi:thiamine-phosphate pyrophosphorylase
MNRDAARERIRGLYGIADAQAAGGDPERLAVHLLAGGCRLLQLRCKGWRVEEIEPVAASVARRCREVRATFLINDHPELVAPSGADGVHLGQLDMTTDEARRSLPANALLGRSTHDPLQIAAACADADYVAFGPVFETMNAGRPKVVQGTAALVAARARVPRSIPLVAIGGITLERLPEVYTAGADSWAVIGAIASVGEPTDATRAWVDASLHLANGADRG